MLDIKRAGEVGEMTQAQLTDILLTGLLAPSCIAGMAAGIQISTPFKHK